MTNRKALSSAAEAAPLPQQLNLEVRRFLADAILFNTQVAEKLGMNNTDMQCLHLLQLNGGAMTPGELGRCCGLSSGGVTVVLDRLEKAGYVTREPNPGDRRSVIVRPVPAALRRLEAIYRDKGEELAQVLARYGQRELRLILDFFRSANRYGQDPAKTA
jgi:MarR family transcriptional regulator, organic hydroperoxide resistance regulator